MPTFQLFMSVSTSRCIEPSVGNRSRRAELHKPIEIRSEVKVGTSTSPGGHEIAPLFQVSNRRRRSKAKVLSGFRGGQVGRPLGDVELRRFHGQAAFRIVERRTGRNTRPEK
jgi:hypothetical protein